MDVYKELIHAGIIQVLIIYFTILSKFNIWSAFIERIIEKIISSLFFLLVQYLDIMDKFRVDFSEKQVHQEE